MPDTVRHGEIPIEGVQGGESVSARMDGGARGAIEQELQMPPNMQVASEQEPISVPSTTGAHQPVCFNCAADAS